MTQSSSMSSSPPASSARVNSKKRKAPEELSQNPNTVKSRARHQAISQDADRLKIEKAKNADRSAVTYAKRQLVRSAAYMNASQEQQQQMIQASAVAVKQERYFLNIPIIIVILIRR